MVSRKPFTAGVTRALMKHLDPLSQYMLRMVTRPVYQLCHEQRIDGHQAFALACSRKWRPAVAMLLEHWSLGGSFSKAVALTQLEDPVGLMRWWATEPSDECLVSFVTEAHELPGSVFRDFLCHLSLSQISRSASAISRALWGRLPPGAVCASCGTRSGSLLHGNYICTVLGCAARDQQVTIRYSTIVNEELKSAVLQDQADLTVSRDQPQWIAVGECFTELWRVLAVDIPVQSYVDEVVSQLGQVPFFYPERWAHFLRQVAGAASSIKFTKDGDPNTLSGCRSWLDQQRAHEEDLQPYGGVPVVAVGAETSAWSKADPFFGVTEVERSDVLPAGTASWATAAEDGWFAPLGPDELKDSAGLPPADYRDECEHEEERFSVVYPDEEPPAEEDEEPRSAQSGGEQQLLVAKEGNVGGEHVVVEK